MGGYKEVYTYLKVISSKVNVITRQEFVLKHSSHYATETLSLSLSLSL